MPDRPDTRRHILSIAQRHLMRRGYNAFSYGDIATELGIKAAAIHYYFPAKTDLVRAVIGAYGARFDVWSGAMASATSAERLAAYFEIGRLIAADGRVCPLSMVVAQQEAIPEEVLADVRQLQVRIIDFYVENLARGRCNGEVHFEGTAEDEGAKVACTLIGAQLLARVYGVEAYLRVMRQQARALGLPETWPSFSLSARGAA
ncbi:MAG TPA: TetR/AcrR family transcriptional regulator [Myxococcota bacterium]|nr:TetR/AcrR family transcriptional regulator [Myxococcota bacterium]